jgi:hypothetical protein
MATATRMVPGPPAGELNFSTQPGPTAPQNFFRPDYPAHEVPDRQEQTELNPAHQQ